MASVFKRGGKGSRGNKWYIQWHDHMGKRRSKCAGTTDKATAERIARKLESEAALRREGVIDPALEATAGQSQRSIESHLADYEAKLRAAGRTDKHVTSTINFIRRIADFAGFASAADISADGVALYAAKLRDEGRSARTIQAHLNAITSLTKWLCENHKLPRDPLASVKKPNPQTDRRVERRPLLPDEWPLLQAATLAGKESYGVSPAERALLYETAIQTGLRSDELRSLTRGRLYLDSEPPYITCKAGSTKNRKLARQYIQVELAAELAAHISTKHPKAPVFAMPHETNLARMLRVDLANARAMWVKDAKGEPDEYARRQESDFLSDTNHDGEVCDFHSLRHTCGAWLALTAAHPKVVQTVMRHSSITLTMDTYGHLFPGHEADAVARLRTFLVQPDRAQIAATGTDGALQLAQQLGRETGRSPANADEDRADPSSQKKTSKSHREKDLDDSVRSDATHRESSGGGTRSSR